MGDIAVDDTDLSLAVDQAAIEAHLRALNVHDLDGAHRVYRRDAVLKVPQQGITIVGRDNIKEARLKKVGRELVAVDVVVGQSDLWIAECVFSEGDKKIMVVSVMEFSDGQIAAEREYVCELEGSVG